ncbi:MAG: Ig-like domain-containing protein, partial [Lachnospiraceae bacterium]|nr:Ig-like domain-containing protein [Lachnospiraceae bacterium]
TGLTKIPAYAFNLCPALEKIVLPYRITTIDANAFTNCTKLTEVTVPRGTTTISTSAFSYPDRLTIYGISGTYAETYANQIGAKFVNREVNATDVTLSSTTLSMITGAKHTLVMSVTPNDFTDEVVWKSSDTNILTVDNMGVITAKAVGTASVRVAVGEKTASCAVTVVQPVTSISLNRSSLSLAAFEDYTLTASVYPDNAADKSVEWTTSDEKIATVSQTGKVTPLSKGTATITVTAKDGSGRYARCTVTVTSEGQLCTQYSQLESPHNYGNNTNKVWKYVYSGAKALEITFDEKTNVDDGFDFIYIYDKDNKELKKATGTELAGQTIQITGDTVKIKLVSDEAITAWGFKVTKISADGKIIDSGEEKPEEPETSTEENSETESSSEEESSEESLSGEESSAEESSTEEESEPDKDLKDGFYITGLKTQTYTGTAIKQDIKVYYNKHLLQESTDYTVSYKNNKNVGKASVTIKSKKNLTGSVTKIFEIQPRNINDTNVIIEDTVFLYDKKPHKKAPLITYNGKTLKEGKDYKVTDYGSGDYTSIGTYTMKIEGMGSFTGIFDDAKVIITDKDHDLSKAKIAKIPVQEYQNGAKVELTAQLIQVTLNKTTLKKDMDYTVSYANNANAGKATLIIKGKGSYAGTKKANFTIKRTPIALSDSMVTNKTDISSAAIQKNGTMPKPKLTSNGYTLAEGRDYTLSYKNHKKTGTGIIKIKGKGSYTGQIEIPYRITEKDLTDTDITIRVPDVPYTGKANKYQSNPVLTDIDGGVLAKNKDYTIEAYAVGSATLDKKSNPEEGTVITVTIKGKGNYTGTVEAAYTLKGISFAQAAIKVEPQFYTGNPVTIDAADIISATIKTGKTQTSLQLGKDYEIAAYSNNLKKGTATVILKGVGDYSGEKAVKFKINCAQIE